MMDGAVGPAEDLVARAGHDDELPRCGRRMPGSPRGWG